MEKVFSYQPLSLCLALLILVLRPCSCAPNQKISSGENVFVIASTQDSSSAETSTLIPDKGLVSKETFDDDDDEADDIIQAGDPFVPKYRPLKPTTPQVYSFRVESRIKYRYSKTYVTSRVANPDVHKAQEVTFSIVLPETAFISKFIMEIDGKVYEAYVKGKEEAKKVYTQAQSQGQTAGLVEASSRNSNTFDVSVNIKAQSKITFNLTYEELLSRRLGRYEQAIHINQKQLSSAKNVEIFVNIEESQNITYLRVPDVDKHDSEVESNIPGVVISQHQSGNKANVSWHPKDSSRLDKGKFVIQYDVNRSLLSGEVLVMEGYFVHYFAPEALRPLRKHVVFILDVSGSMWGRKLEQLKESQKKILEDLQSGDFFNIITFSSDVFLWAPNDTTTKHSLMEWPPSVKLSPASLADFEGKIQPFPATKENIQKAKKFIDSLIASGGTNIHDSIITALNLTSTIKAARDKSLSQDHAGIEQSVGPITEDENLRTNASSTNKTSILAHRQPRENILPKNVESMIIFLTDGEPTVGITEPEYIQKLIQSANRNLTVPIFSLGFGEGADFPFLRRLSLQNYGFARKIYEASDAALQLKGFYNEIASPLLANVTFNYTSSVYNVTDLTITKFPTVFGGTEVAVAGRLTPVLKNETSDVEPAEMTTVLPVVEEDVMIDDDKITDADSPILHEEKKQLHVGILGSGREGIVEFKAPPVVFCNEIDIQRPPFPPRPTPPPSEEESFLERLWAYLTIQQLIEEDLKGSDPKLNEVMVEPVVGSSSSLPNQNESVNALNPFIIPEKESPKQRATNLALKYGFVTPFTSLVVVKPNRSDITETRPADSSTLAPFNNLVSYKVFGPPPGQQQHYQQLQLQPPSLQRPNMANRIVGHSPLPMSTRARPSHGSLGTQHGSAGYGWGSYSLSSSSNKRRKPHPSSLAHAPTTTLMLLPTTTTIPSAVNLLPQEHEYDYTLVEGEEATTTRISQLTFDDIEWFNASNPTLRVNDSEYLILTDGNKVLHLKDNHGYECNVSSDPEPGSCVHLKDCVKPVVFLANVDIFKRSHFCPIESTFPTKAYYVGVCCAAIEGLTTPTPALTVP